MNEQLDMFLKSTEDSLGGINQAANSKGIQYPFVYIESITDVELRYLADNEYLLNNKSQEDYLPLYLNLEKGYRLLGYIELTWSAIIHISYLQFHKTYIKTDKDHVSELTGELFDSLLLSS